MQTRGRTAAILISAAILTTAVAACGGSTQPACIVIDASKSTRYAVYDYLGRFDRESAAVAEAGGSLAVVVATGEPMVESDVEVSEDFGELGGADRTSQRAAAVEDFTRGVHRGTRLASTGLANPSSGSGIVAAVSLVAGQGCASIEALSDGLEAADVRMKREDILTPSGRARLLDRLEARGLLPDLSGVELRFPFGGYLPQGTSIPKARLDAVPKFWTDYSDRTGAVLVWQR